jgi:hypothetical protein
VAWYEALKWFEPLGGFLFLGGCLLHDGCVTRTFWSVEDDRFIMDNRGKKSLAELAEQLERTKSSVHNRLRILDGRRGTKAGVKSEPKRRMRNTMVVARPIESRVLQSAPIQLAQPFIVTVPDVMAKTFGGLYNALRVLFSTPVPGTRYDFSTPPLLIEAVRHAASKQHVNVVVLDVDQNHVGDVVNGVVRNQRFIVLVRSFYA